MGRRACDEGPTRVHYNAPRALILDAPQPCSAASVARSHAAWRVCTRRDDLLVLRIGCHAGSGGDEGWEGRRGGARPRAA